MSDWEKLAATLENGAEMYYRRRDAMVKMVRLDPLKATAALLVG